METLDKCFENVCELDLIFHMDKVLLSQARVAGKLRTLTISSYLVYSFGSTLLRFVTSFNTHRIITGPVLSFIFHRQTCWFRPMMATRPMVR